MDDKPTAISGLQGVSDPQVEAPAPVLRRIWRGIRGRFVGGLLFLLPILVTLWVIVWLYSNLETYVIDPLAKLIVGRIRGAEPGVDLPPWFEKYVAPLIAVLIALLILYVLGFLVHTRLRRALDWVLLRVPLISIVYNGVRKVVQAIDRKPGEQRPQRVVLVAFPHPGMRVPAFVTATCRDVETQRVILCVYVPTTPIPTSGYFLLVPEDEVTELNWTSEQAVQAIISAGLTAPPAIAYFKTKAAAESSLAAAPARGSAALDGQMAHPNLPHTGEIR
jgi:uncharacterized membrane protein